MTDDRRVWNPQHGTDAESGLRRLRADATGELYEAFSSLAQAQAASDAIVILEGDDGGQIYVVAAAKTVHCDEVTLQQLLADLDAREWRAPDMARVFYERRADGGAVAGGMGGGMATYPVWVHPRLSALATEIEEVLASRRPRISAPAG